MRKRCNRRPIVPMAPPGMRPKLVKDQVRDLDLVHVSNLDAIARGGATEAQLWDWVASVLTWCRAAELQGVGIEEMAPQRALADRLIARFEQTGRVLFSGPDYQLAKTGIEVMNELARTVDRANAIRAADWSEIEVNKMAEACAARRDAGRLAA